MKLKITWIVTIGFVICLIFSGWANAWADQQNVLLKVPKASCASHIPVVTFAAMSIEGVSNVDVNIEETTITLTFDDEKITIEKIKTALKKADYTVAGEPVFIKK